jgi:hypothetical protein
MSTTNSKSIRAEITGGDTCSALGIIATGHAPVLALCRELLAAGLDPDAAVEAWRAGTLALRVRSISAGALLTVEDDSRGTPRFRPWRGGAASLVRQNGVADTGYPADASPLLAGGGR